MEYQKHTSLKDLAKALGVSIPTVSRALKDSPEISSELRTKVKKLAKEKEGIESVFTAIEAGMNFIDVSPYYGHYKAETVLGKALKDVPRDRYYLSTKVGRYGKDGVNTWDYSAKRAVESVYESMERLNIDFIDLINVHDIEFADLNQIVNETLPALVGLR